MFKNTASQKVIVFAFDATTNVPKTGDAANITAYVSKDFGAVTVLGDTSATEMDATNAPGYYLFDITQTETNADTILVSGKSSTANIKILGAPAAIFTEPANFTSTSIDSNGRLDIIKVNGTSQTAGDIFSKVSGLTYTVGSQVDVNLKSWRGTAAAAENTPGVPIVDVARINNIVTTSVVTVSAKIGTTSAILFDGNGNVKADAESWLGTTIVTPASAGTPDINVKSFTNGSLHQATFASDVPSLATRTGTAQAGGASTITLDSGASATDNFYKFQTVELTGGTGAGQTNVIASYVGATKIATLDHAWATNPDNTSTFILLLSSALPSATALTGAQIATAIFTDTVAGDFTVANSVGKSIMNGIALGTGLTIVSVSGSVGSVTGLTASNLDTTVSSRMATYTQPTGFLAATFPSGTIANTTNITAGIITTVTNLTNAPTAGDFTATMKTSLNASTPASITGAVGSVTAGVTLAASQLFAKKNTQLTAFMFKMVLASDHITAATGKTVVCQRSIDGGAFANCTNTPATEVSAGWYKVTLSAADMNGTTIALKFTEASCDQRDILIITQA